MRACATLPRRRPASDEERNERARGGLLDALASLARSRSDSALRAEAVEALTALIKVASWPTAQERGVGSLPQQQSMALALAQQSKSAPSDAVAALRDAGDGSSSASQADAELRHATLVLNVMARSSALVRRRLIESKVAEALTARLANEAAGALARGGGTLAEAVGVVDEGGGNDGPPAEQEGADDEGASDAGASEDGGPPPVFDDLGAPPPRPTRAQLAAQAEARRIDEEAKARARAYELRNRKPNYAPVLPPPEAGAVGSVRQMGVQLLDVLNLLCAPGEPGRTPTTAAAACPPRRRRWPLRRARRSCRRGRSAHAARCSRRRCAADGARRSGV